jgi:hypothetical protein
VGFFMFSSEINNGNQEFNVGFNKCSWLPTLLVYLYVGMYQGKN